MKFSRLLLFPLLLLSSFAMSDSLAPLSELKLQTENFPPYNYSIEGKNFAKDRDVAGISVDIVREMFERAQVPMSVTLRFPWKRIYDMALDKGNYGVFSMVRSDEREDLFHWVGPLAPDEWVFFARADSSIAITDLKQAQRLKVGGYKGDALTDYLIEQGINVSASAQDKLNVKKLLDGTVDLWASNAYSARILARQQGEAFQQFKAVYTVDKVDLYLGLNKAVPLETVNKLQAALNTMHQDGRVQAIIDQYLN